MGTSRHRMDLIDEIRRLLTENFPAARSVVPGEHDDLLEGGILDSVGVLTLVQLLEDRFSVTVSDEDLVPEHFRSLAALAAFLRLKASALSGNGRPSKSGADS